MTRYDLFRIGTALSLVLASACGDDDTPGDTGGIDTGGMDTGGTDTGGMDTGGMDTGQTDTGGDTVADTGGDTAVADTGTDTGPATIVTVTVDNDRNADYNFTMEDPADSGVIGAGAADQTITLMLDQRYSFVILAPGPHPFEFITDNAPGMAGDTVVLSQRSGQDGTLEDDPTVDWDETTTAGTITFTASASFMSAIDGYRCGTHQGNMRGVVMF